ncbi:MAG TPA: riboflavin synthase [Chitinophagaceae bacterium]
MFTGIIETCGFIKNITINGSNKTFWIESDISGELKIDQSVSHSGACLTVEQIEGSSHQVTAIEETSVKTNINDWKIGDIVNLERSLKMDSRLDGHFVQGHVDAIAVCEGKKEKDGSWEYEFSFPKKFSELVIEKGSVCINGISLTAFDVKKKSFKVAIIPYTYEHTNIKTVKEKDSVNAEFDMIGKYVLRKLSLKE